jgi:hypothetical protein
MSGTPPPTDPNPALRAQLEASIAVIEPQIRGLIDLRATPAQADLATDMTAQITLYQNWRALLQNVLNDLNQTVVDMEALEATGWPNWPVTELPGSVYTELQGELSDIAAAAATFSPVGQIITAGPMTLTDNPDPPTKPGP